MSVSGSTTFATVTATGLTVNGEASITGTLTLSKTQDAAGGANNSPALILGGAVSAAHLEFDSNEIIAKATATTAADLYINTDGGKVYLSNGSAISASNGTMAATTFSGTTGNFTNSTIANGVISRLYVPGELRALQYNIQSINNLGGSFLIGPTINVPVGNNVSITAINTTTNVVTANISGSFSLTTFPTVIWAANSKIKISGSIGGIPIGTCDGKLRAALTTSAIQVEFTYGGQGTKPLSVANNQASVDLAVMIYTVGATNPIGIYMTSWGDTSWTDTTAQNKSSISIYGGTTSSDVAPTVSTPVVRIGNLSGLPAVNGSNPVGWGIYAQHGYFSGTIVSTSGNIGGWVLGSSDIHSTGHNAWNTANAGLYLGTTKIAGGSGGTWYLNEDGTGKVGRWAFASNGDLTTTVSNNTAGMGNANYAFWAGAASGSAASAPFRVTYAGALTATSATITGAITATSGTIGSNSTAANRWQIGDKAIYNTCNSMTSTGVGTYVGVDGIRNYKSATAYVNIKDGVVTALGANITGTIHATGGEFGSASGYHIKIGTSAIDFFKGVETTSSNKYGSIGTNVWFGKDITIGSLADNSLVVGDTLSVDNDACFVQGYSSSAEGYASMACGYNCHTYNSYSFARGYACNAYGGYSFADGCLCTTGDQNSDTGQYSHAEGYSTTATGNASHSEGRSTTALGDYSHAEGYSTLAYGDYSFASGYYTCAYGDYSHAEGINSTTGKFENDVASGGEYAHAEGQNTTAFGMASHAEGYLTQATGDYSHAEGGSGYIDGTFKGPTASGLYSHAEGMGSLASGAVSHAEGSGTTASQHSAHAEGISTTASGQHSHAEGGGSVASGWRSHAQNGFTIAASDNQTAIGRYNIQDSNNVYAFIIGNGDLDDNDNPVRSNAFTVDWSGNVVASGSVTATSFVGNASSATKATQDANGAAIASTYAKLSGAAFTGNISASNFFPVNSIYITSTNTNPSTILGFGTWTLFDKHYAPTMVTDAFTLNSTNVSALSGAWVKIAEHNILIRIQFTNKIAYADSTIDVGTFNLAKIGLASGKMPWYSGSGYSDNGNAIVMPNIDGSGKIQITDVVANGTATQIAAGNSMQLLFTVTVHTIADMLDSFCDKFFWKRTA